MKSFVVKIVIRLFFLALLGAGIWLWFALSPVRHAPGVLIGSEPVQTLEAQAYIPTPVPKSFSGYNLTSLGTLHLHGRVLSVRRYHDEHAELAPIDVVLGWGAMSDTATLEGIVFRQEQRGVTLENQPPPEALHQYANLHLVPSDREVAAYLGQLKPGTLVAFRGALIEAVRGTTRWRSTFIGEKGGKLLFLHRAKGFDGNQDLHGKEHHLRLDEATRALHRWYARLQEKRERLAPDDAEAVRAFNLEAQLYMERAHPQRRSEGGKP